MIDFLLISLGLAGLLAGTHFVIEGAVNIARHHRLSDLFVGLTILSIGSDLPELAVAIDSGLRTLNGTESSGIVVGSSIGSCFGQIGLALGFIGLAGSLRLSRIYIYRHGSMLLFSVALLATLGLDGQISTSDGLLLMTCFLLYLIVLYRAEQSKTGTTEQARLSQMASWSALSIGILVVTLSSDLTVNSASNIAHQLGLSQMLIAIIIIGPGTSLPELVISLMAIIRKRHSLSIGNLIGSTTFDALVPIGAAAMISDVQFDAGLIHFDLPALFILCLLVMILLTGTKGLQKSGAAFLLVYYFSYIVVTSRVVF